MRRLIAPRPRHNPTWLKRLARLIGNYRYWRSRGNTMRASWRLARNTI